MSNKGHKGAAVATHDDDAARVARLGAARDGVQAECNASALPRILRYACLPNAHEIVARVAADVAVLAPDLSDEANTWAATVDQRGWPSLAEALDEAAVHLDRPALRGLADIVRLVSMTVAEFATKRGDALRVLAALELADDPCRDWLEDARPHLAEVDIMRIGWGRLVVSQLDCSLDPDLRAYSAAHRGGEVICRNIVAVAEDETRRAIEGKAGPSAKDVAVAEPRAEAMLDDRDSMVVCEL